MSTTPLGEATFLESRFVLGYADTAPRSSHSYLLTLLEYLSSHQRTEGKTTRAALLVTRTPCIDKKRRAMPAAKKPKLPSSADKVDAYYTHTETEGTSLEDIAIDLLRSESASVPLAQVLDPAHGLNLLESLCIENTVGSKPDSKTGVFIQQLFGLSDDLWSQITSSFTFRAPLKVGYVGRSALGLSCGSVVDVAVDMPGSCFDDKDYLNHRYHAKRVLYLDCLRVALSGKMGAKSRRETGKGKTGKGKGTSARDSGADVLRVEWDTEVVDPRKPVLRLEMVALPGVEFRVHASLEQKRAAWLKKVAPDAANLRSYGKMTPLYNHSIAEDLLVLWHAEEVALMAGRFPIFADVVLLLDIWARNHGLAGFEGGLVASTRSRDGGRGAMNWPPATTEDLCGLDVSFFAALVALVLRNDTQMQYSTQRMHVFRGAMQVLCGADSRFVCPGKAVKKWGVFSGEGSSEATLRLQSTFAQASASEAPSRNSWRSAFKDGVLFVSRLTGSFTNVAARMSRDALVQARAAALETSHVLVSMSTPDAIDAIFMKKSNPVMLYDLWCACEVAGDGPAATSTVAVSRDASDRQLLEECVHRVASKALGDRATLVRVLHAAYTVATNTSGALVAMYSTRTSIRLCCRLHAINSMRIVDIGPAADDTSGAAEFRAFWGAKSELRRFQDGKICESVAWASSDENSTNRYHVTRQLLNFIVPHHCPEVTGVEAPAMVLTQALQRANASPSSEALYERACLDGVTKLTKMLRGLDAEGIPLSVVNVQPVAAVLRNTAVYPPVPHQLAGSSLADTSDVIPRCLPAIEVLCQLEGSGKWPDAPAAYAKMKAALGVQFARALKSSYSIDAIASEHCIDVMLDGFAYRLELYSEREPADVLATITLRQAHQGLISSLVAEHPSFKPCCRMAKLWISRQHLSNHICEEATELVCAAAYTTKISIGGACPTSPESGFLSFLDIMAYHPWEAQPLTLDAKVSEEAARLMSRMRAIGKAPSMFVVMGSAGTTDSDSTLSHSSALPPSKASLSNKLQCVAWTAQAPDEIILFRASALARKAIKSIVSDLNSDYNEHSGMPGPLSPLPSRVFGHPMSDYDIVVVLKASALVGDRTEARGIAINRNHRIDASSETTGAPGATDGKYCQAVLSGIPKSLVQQRGAKIKRELLVGFDPMPLFCELLRDRYQHVAIVCANILDGTTIGIKIKPRFCRPEGVAFDADFGCSVFRPVSGLADGCGDTVVVCKEAFAHDILQLGSGIVDSVNY